MKNALSFESKFIGQYAAKHFLDAFFGINVKNCTQKFGRDPLIINNKIFNKNIGPEYVCVCMKK